MQSSAIVLYNLSKQATNNTFQYDRLYRHFYNEDFYEEASKKCAIRLENETIQSLIASMKLESFNANEERQKSVQTVRHIAAMIIRSLYHFKRDEDVYESIREAKGKAHYFVKCTFEKQGKSATNHAIIDALRDRIKDEKFIRLMWKLLKSTQHDHEMDDALDQLLEVVLLQRWKNRISTLCEKATTIPYEAFYVVHDFSVGNEYIVALMGTKAQCRAFQEEVITNFKKDGVNCVISSQSCNQPIAFQQYEIRIDAHTSKWSIRIPKKVLHAYINEHRVVKNSADKKWITLHKGEWTTRTDAQIVVAYNRLLATFLRTYAEAENKERMYATIYPIMESSCFKTLASKHKCSVKQLGKRIVRNPNGWGVLSPKGLVHFIARTKK